MTRTKTLVSFLLATSALVLGGAQYAAAGQSTDSSAKPVTLAIIGDVPYGAAQEATFDVLIDAVNADPKVRSVVHVGDIKNGSTPCTDERFATVRAAFDRFEDPVVYTPGDNEWTDCHRPAAGGYDPIERLAKLRELFFAEPGSMLGRHPNAVEPQLELVESVRCVESQVVFATLHVVGSDNGLAPWTGMAAPTEAQSAEVAARTAATLAWIDAAFDTAEAEGLPGVALIMQADTYSFAETPGLAPINAKIAERAAGYDGEVLVVQGDSHVYLVDHPLPGEDLTRVVVHGETLPFEYLRLTVDPHAAELFSWERAQALG